MTNRVRWVVGGLTLAAVVLGGLVGYMRPEWIGSLGFIGTLFVNSLRLIAVPLVIAGVVAGIASIGQMRRAGATIGYSLVYFIGTTIIAMLVGILLVYAVNPGVGVDQSAGFVPAQVSRISNISAGDVLTRLIPDSQVGAILSGNYFGIILFGIVFGLAVTGLGRQQRLMIDLARAIRDSLFKLVPYLLFAAPIGLFFLVGQSVAEADINNSAAFTQLRNYLVVVLGTMAVHGVIILPLILKFLGKRSPMQYAGSLFPAFGTAIGTGSSLTTIPVTYECVTKNARVDSRASAITVPLGATMNLDGSAITGVVVAMFVSQAFGVDLSVLQILMIAVMTLLVSIGTSGLPGSSLLSAALVFSVVGVPTEAYAGLGLVIAADWLVNRGRAVINVWSDAVGATVVEQYLNQGKKAARSSTRQARPAQRDRRPDRQRSQVSDRDNRKGGKRGRHRDDDRRNDRDKRRERDRRDNFDQLRDQPSEHRHRPDRSSPFALQPNGRPEFSHENPELTAVNGGSNSVRDNTAAPSVNGPHQQGRNDRHARRYDRKRQRQDRPRSGSPDRSRSDSATHHRNSRRDRDNRNRNNRDDRHNHKERKQKAVDIALEVEKTVPQTSAELGPETIERERERVSAQLAALRLNENRVKQNSEQKEDVSAITNEPIQPESVEESFPQIDYMSDENHKEQDHKQTVSEPEAATAVAEPVEGGDDESNDAAISYGRRKTRKGEKFIKARTEEKTETEKSDHPDPGMYSVEKQTFGRSKKPRVR